MNLGLTRLEATIYLTLTNLKKADVKTIAKASQVARSEVYRIMPTLEKMGLAEKNVAKTTMYKATLIKDAIPVLLENKKREYAEIEHNTNIFLNDFNEIDLQDFLERDAQFKITSEWTLLKKMHEKMIQTAQTSICITIPAKMFQKMIETHGSCLREAKEKGVKIRAIIQKVGEDTPSRQVQTIFKDLFTEFEYVPYSDLFGMHIFDHNEVTLNVTAEGGASSLWSNDPNVVKLAKAYFEYMWENLKITKNLNSS